MASTAVDKSSLTPADSATQLRGRSGSIWRKKPKVEKNGILGRVANSHWRENETWRPVTVDIAWSGSAGSFATVSERGTVVELHPRQNKYTTLSKANSAGFVVEYSKFRDNEVMAGFSDGSVAVWCSGRLQATLAAHSEAVRSIVPLNAATFITASSQSAALWCSSTWTKLKVMHIQTAGTRLVSLQAAGGTVVALMSDSSLAVWDAAALASDSAPQPQHRLVLPEDEADVRLRCVALSTGGAYAAAGGDNGAIYVWDTRSGDLTRILDMPPGEERVAAVQFLPRASLPKHAPGSDHTVQQGLLVLGSTGTVHVLALAQDTAASLGSLRPRSQAVVAMRASPSGAHAALATSDGSVFLYDMRVCMRSFAGQDTSAARSRLLREAFPGSPSTRKKRSKVMPLLKKQAQRLASAASTSDPTAASGASGSRPAFKWQRAGPPGHVNTAAKHTAAKPTGKTEGRGATPLGKVDSNRAGRRAKGVKGGSVPAVPPAPSVSSSVATGMPQQTGTTPVSGCARDFAMAHLRNSVTVACGQGRGEGLPAATRLDAWRLALALPGNCAAFKGCSTLPLPAMQDDIVASARISSPRLERQLRACLACLVQWCPDLAQVTHLAETSFPFVRMWGVDGTAAAESCMVFWGTWGRRWLESAPLPPLPTLGAAWAVLEQADGELADHLLRCGADAGVAFWPMLRGLLSDVLTDGAWTALWDTLAMFVADTALLPLAAVAIVTLMRTTLLSLPPAPHAPPKGSAAKAWAASGQQSDPACPATAAVTRVLGSVTPLRAKDVILQMWKLRRGCEGGVLAALQGKQSAWAGEGPPAIGEGCSTGAAAPSAPAHGASTKPQLHTRKDGLVLAKVTIRRPAPAAAPSAGPFAAPPADASKVWLPHPEGGLASHPGLVVPKADQYAPLPGGYLPVAQVQHQAEMWEAIKAAEAATLQRKEAAAQLQAAAQESAAAAAAERASGITAAGAAARHVAQQESALRQREQQRAAVDADTRSAQMVAETALHAARRDLIAARNASAAAAASASDERAALAADDWNAFATQGMAAEEARANRLAAELRLVQEQHSSVREQVMTAQLAAQSSAATNRRLQQVALSAQMRTQDEAEEAQLAAIQREAEAAGQAALQSATADANAAEKHTHALTAQVAMAGINRQRTLRHAALHGAAESKKDSAAETAAQRRVEAAVAAQAVAEARLAEVEAQLQAVQGGGQGGGSEASASDDGEELQGSYEDSATGLASQSDVDRAVDAAVWRSMAAITTRPSVSHDVSPAQGTPVMPAGSPASQRPDEDADATERDEGEGTSRSMGGASAGGTGEPTGTRGVRHTPVKSHALGATQRRLPTRSPFVPGSTASGNAAGAPASPADSSRSSQGSEEDWLRGSAAVGRQQALHAPSPPPGMATFHAKEGARLVSAHSPLSATHKAPPQAARQGGWRGAAPAAPAPAPAGDLWVEGSAEGDALEADSLGGTFDGGQDVATGGVIPRGDTSAQEAAATADVAQLVARYTMAIQGGSDAPRYAGGGDDSPSDDSGHDESAGEYSGSEDASGDASEAAAAAAGGLRYQPLEDESDEEYDEESAVAEMAMQAAALGSDMFSPGAGYDTAPQVAAEWVDSSSGSSGSGGAEETFESLLATSLSPVPEGVPKYAAQGSLSTDNSAGASPVWDKGAAPPAQAQHKEGGLQFGVAIVDAAGSFQDDVQVQDGRWVHRDEQTDFLSGSTGGGQVVPEHVQRVKEAVSRIEASRSDVRSA